MKTKTIFALFILFCSGSCLQAYSQQAIEDLIPRIERISESPPRRNTIDTNASMIRRQEDGSILEMRKQFTINDYPNLVKELIQAFNQEREKARSVTESKTNGKVFRRYAFTQGGITTTCILNGTEDKMIFFYVQKTEGTTGSRVETPMSNEERFFRGLPPE
jgi:hypothetical protein